MTRVVVDIGEATACAVVAAGRRPVRWGMVRLGGPEAVDRSGIRDPEAVTARYRRLVAALGVRPGTPATVLVPTLWVVGDRVDVPRGLPRRRVGAALRSLAQKRLGGLETLHLVTRVVAREPHWQAFALGVLREPVQAHCAALAAAGLRVEAVTLHTWAAAALRPLHTGLLVVADPEVDHVLSWRDRQPAAAYARDVPLGLPPAVRAQALAADALALTRGTAATPVVVLTGPAGTPELAAALDAAGVHAARLEPRCPADWPADRLAPALGALRGGLRGLELDPDAVPPAVRQAPGRILAGLAVAALVGGGSVAAYRSVYSPRLAALRATATRLAEGAAFRHNTALALEARDLAAQIARLEQAAAALHPTVFPWAAAAQALTAQAGGVAVTTAQAADGPGGTTLSVTGTAPTLGALTAYLATRPPALQDGTLTGVTVSGGVIQFSATFRFVPTAAR